MGLMYKHRRTGVIIRIKQTGKDRFVATRLLKGKVCSRTKMDLEELYRYCDELLENGYRIPTIIPDDIYF